MATQITPEGNVIAPLNISAPHPVLSLEGFKWNTVDEKIQGTPQGKQLGEQLGKPKDSFLPPFPLEQFHGAYAGNGFNLIWRPRPDDDTTFPVPAIPPKKKPEGPGDNILELNLTTEQLTFGENLGKIPNRGLFGQSDINLAGIPYLQTVQDVTFPATGKGDNPIPTGIHFEPGVWLHVPKSKHHENPTGSVTRMASIPHGTTINAQGLVPTRVMPPESKIGGAAGPPEIEPIDTAPFDIGNPKARRGDFFPSMKAANQNTFRIPQNLEKFQQNGTITTEIIKNPHLVLRNVIKNQKITETITFEVSTGLPTAKINGGGISNISFLMGKQDPGDKDAPPDPVAHPAFMTSIFWIERVEYQVPIKASFIQSTQDLRPDMSKSPTAPTPKFAITTPQGGVPEDTIITVPGIQIQYSQTVNLNFGFPNGHLTWPHVSVATLVPTNAQPFQMT